jgi:hypothetical protein
VHLTGLAAVVSVHITMLSAPVKHASLTEAVPSLSVALPVQGAPEDIAKPPIGPHELIVVAGTGGCGATCKHPAIVNPSKANIATIPRILPPPSSLFITSRPTRLAYALILFIYGNRVAHRLAWQ